MTNSSFQDHFSTGSSDYAAYRPRYPDALFDWLASVAPRRTLAWDCATGTGQAAVALARHFDRVVASDAAAAQIDEAQPAERVAYAVFPAEQAELPSRSVDLVTVAQALHWFEHERFYAEVRRVLVPGGVLAAWTYELFRIESRIDAIIEAWYRGPIDGYWPAARRHIEAGYRTIPFPFEPLEAPSFEMEADWRLRDVLGYLGTWSAAKRFRDARGEDAVMLIRDELAAAWGNPEDARRVVWSMPLLVGR
jgi:SAM-dependent methyltransferase